MSNLHREPSTQLHPTCTQFHVCITVETTSLDAKVWDAGDGKLQCLRDTKVHVSPVRVGVTTCVEN